MNDFDDRIKYAKVMVPYGYRKGRWWKVNQWFDEQFEQSWTFLIFAAICVFAAGYAGVNIIAALAFNFS